MALMEGRDENGSHTHEKRPGETVGNQRIAPAQDQQVERCRDGILNEH